MSFSEQTLVDKLKRLKQTEDSIQTLSQWMLMYAKHWKKAVDIWTREFRSGGVDRKLLLYVANDVMQTSRSKTGDFIKGFAKVLPDCYRVLATETNPSVLKATNRLLDVWQQRSVFSPDFIRGLRGRLGGGRAARG